MTVETSLQYVLTPFPLSLFSNKDQKMNKANKADFSKTSLKTLTELLDLTNQPCGTLVIDGGWLLYMVKWEQQQTWQEIANRCMNYVHHLGCCSQKIIVVFDGYSRSPKDHDYIRRTKNSCCDLKIRPDMVHWTPRASSWDNIRNKRELIHLLPSENITSLWSRVTMMLTLRLWERHWLLLQIPMLRSVTFVSVFPNY